MVFVMANEMIEGFRPTASGVQVPDWLKMNLEVKLYSESRCKQGRITEMRLQTSTDLLTLILKTQNAFFAMTLSQGREEWAAKLKSQSIGV